MTIKSKLIITSIAIAAATAAISWFSYINISSGISKAVTTQQTNKVNQLQNSVNLAFNQFIQTGHSAESTDAIKSSFQQTDLPQLLSLLNAAANNTTEIALYNADNNQLLRPGLEPQQGEFYELEHIILSQMKSPGSKTTVTKFDKHFALVKSQALLIDDKVTGIIFNVLKLNNVFFNHLKQQTGADFKLSINGSSLTTNSALPYNESQQLTWPIQSKVSGKIYYHLPNASLSQSLPDTGIISIILIIILMSALVILTFMFISGHYRSLKKLSQASQSVENANQLSKVIKSLNIIPELEDFTNSVNQLVTQQNTQLRNMQTKLKQLDSTLHNVKSEKVSLQVERDSAVQAPKTKSEFLSRMGDEITTPMKTLTSMLHLLSEYSLDEEPKELLSIARRSSNTLINNLNNILDFSKLDANLLKLYKNDFDVRQLIEETISEYTPHAKSKSLQLSCNIANEVPEHIYNDSKRVKQILKNLLGNAIRFTKDGEVSVYCDLVMEQSVEYLRLTIQDSGVGIPEEAQRGLFDSLEQRTKLTNSSFAGRLRLIVSKKLSELMGGNIGVNSEPQKGSRFWFTVSLHKD
ncbi:sensor histidine kinase [Pleionea mediterranea]|uniref:histidine kinase n=1 Tax=Pleionea mediterranea TaxID=523701 RepID=A0A316G065_9GAMM|nr:ATP-binding protein [Pleionea mediterranea]PWK54291.1 phospho-acceptor domain-containing protein [Pleionea mediterranea]